MLSSSASPEPALRREVQALVTERNAGSLVAGAAVTSVSCTDDECSVRGELFEFLFGLAESNMYMLGSHRISSDGQTLLFQRSGGVDLKTGLYVRFPGPP